MNIFLQLDTELKTKFGDTHIKGLLADFGENVHLGKINGRYVLLVEADTIEFHRPDDLHEIIERISRKGVGEY